MVRAFWMPNHNFGDNLNHYILSRIAKDGVVFTDILDAETKVVSIGTILGWCNETTIAWGPGLGNVGDAVNPLATIRAVRGPRSRKRALECGCKCPDVFGDPALLMPRIYRPVTEVRHKVGLIPHYVDQKVVYQRYRNTDASIRVIDILDTPERVVDAIASCEMILSSSLHGVIAAHAYGIPAAWVEFGDKIGGDGTKYHDYFESVGCTVADRINCRDMPAAGTMLSRAKSHLELKVHIDTDPLLASAPFELAPNFGSGGAIRA
ncbi:polysaccharide pyruvyl transferase family protein [Bosea sp. NPDC003192]|uniref:polysaccharide pyruvyl transferase family protein n=1 Tax=Bosea sp. NPDC003192 TaxID=3390551 RepID=UPI003D05C5E7